MECELVSVVYEEWILYTFSLWQMQYMVYNVKMTIIHIHSNKQKQKNIHNWLITFILFMIFDY